MGHWHPARRHRLVARQRRWLGRRNDFHCALFVVHGFAALNRNYTQNAQWLMDPDIHDGPLEGTQKALTTMRTELSPFGGRLGLFGISRGAEHGLLLAKLVVKDGCAEAPDAIAVHSPPDATWPAFIVTDFQTGKPWAARMSGPGQERYSAPVQFPIPCSLPKAPRTGRETPAWHVFLPPVWLRMVACPRRTFSRAKATPSMPQRRTGRGSSW